MPCLQSCKDIMSSILEVLREGDWKIAAYILGPIFSLGFGLCVGAYTSSLKACDTPWDADYCYVCDEDPCDTPYVGDCNEQGGCWCRGEDYSDYFCVDQDWTATTFYAVFGGLVMLLFVAGIFYCLAARSGCMDSADQGNKMTTPLVKEEQVNDQQ